MLFSLDLLLSEKWSWFPTSSQALHLLLKPDDCSVLVIWSSKTQSMNNYLFLLFCGSVTRDNSSRDFHPLRYSFADVVQADDDVGLCQHFYVEFLCCLKVPDIEVVFNRRILLFLTRLWPNIEWLWPKEWFYSCNWSTDIKGADPPVRSFPIEHIAIEVGTKVVTGPEPDDQDYNLTYTWSILTSLKIWKYKQLPKGHMRRNPPCERIVRIHPISVAIVEETLARKYDI